MAPSDSRIFTMNRVSLKSGTRRMTHGSSVSRVAAMMGKRGVLAAADGDLAMHRHAAFDEKTFHDWGLDWWIGGLLD